MLNQNALENKTMQDNMSNTLNPKVIRTEKTFKQMSKKQKDMKKMVRDIKETCWEKH